MKLSQILGALFLLAGIALAVLCFVMPGSMQAIGLTQEVAAILLVGGGICLGLGSVENALHVEHAISHTPEATIDDPRRMPPPAERPRPPEPPPAPEAKPGLKAFGKGTAAAVATEAVTETVGAARPSVAETIEALEQAKSDIASALSIEKPAPAVEPRPSIASVLEKPLGEKPRQEPPAVLVMPPPPPPPPPPPAAAEEVEEADDPDLYVVEEKVIRGRPARVLSDGTVEAETDEGWMRFENLEHLDEYLDAMSPGS